MLRPVVIVCHPPLPPPNSDFPSAAPLTPNCSPSRLARGRQNTTPRHSGKHNTPALGIQNARQAESLYLVQSALTYFLFNSFTRQPHIPTCLARIRAQLMPLLCEQKLADQRRPDSLRSQTVKPMGGGARGQVGGLLRG